MLYMCRNISYLFLYTGYKSEKCCLYLARRHKLKYHFVEDSRL